MPRRRAFTLIELLTVIALLGLLIAIVVPAISSARATSLDARCKSNLRQFFIGFHNFADHDPQARFSSGATWAFRGCLDSTGWVADLVNSSSCRLQELLCPANSARVSIVFDSYLTQANFKRTGSCASFGNGVASATPNELADQLLARGFGTNYGTSFYFDSTEPLVAYTGGKLVTAARSVGPLRRTALDQSPIVSSVVPLVADVNRELEYSIGYQNLLLQADLVASDGTTFAVSGTPLAHTGFGDHIVGADVAKVIAFEQPSAGQVVTGTAPYTLRTGQIGPLHRGSAHIVMGDGSVRVLRDRDANGSVEFSPTEMFTGIFISRMAIRDSLIP